MSTYLVPVNANYKAIEKYIGKTPLFRTNNLADYLACEHLYVKFEGSNPTGTQKDRIASALAKYAKDKGYLSMTTASCGNFGVALAFFGKVLDLETHIFIPANYHVPNDRMDRMRLYDACIHYTPGTYEEAVEVSKQEASHHGWFDANPGSDLNTCISVSGYSTIASEIYSSLRRSPNYVICPVGNGTTLAGIFQGFLDLKAKNKISTLPKMIASSTPRGNPIVNSFKMGKRTITDLEPSVVKETQVNEPLTNWHSYDGQLALDTIYNSLGYAEYATDHQMLQLTKLLLREEGVYAQPASTSSLAILPRLFEESNVFERKNNVLKGHIVAILTGRGIGRKY